MDENVRHLRNWCLKEREQLQNSLEQMRTGVSHTHQRTSGGSIEDTTDKTIAETETKIADLDALLAKVRADHS